MRGFVFISTILALMLGLTWSAAIGQPEQENNDADILLGADSGVDENNGGTRQVRQLLGGIYGYPYNGGYYGAYYRPSYIYNHVRPYYTAYYSHPYFAA